MSKLLEIFGRAITVDTAELIWHWLNALKIKDGNTDETTNTELDEIIELIGNMQLEKALEKTEFYLFENPDCTRGRMAAVAICLHQNQIKQAIEQLQSVYLRQPSNTMALYALGYCYERMENLPQAIEFYQDCIKFKAHLQLPRQRMAAIYLKNARLDKTIEQYRMLIEEYAEDTCSMVLLGYLYIADHQYKAAIDAFNLAIVAHPDNFNDDGQDDQINRFIEDGQFDRAIESIQWLMEKVGQMPDLYVKMGDILSRAEKPADALVQYQNALRIQPNYLEATIKLGTLHLRFRQLILAAERFNTAIEINDEIVDAYLGLTIAYALDEDINEAARTMSLAAAIQQNSTLLFSETATLHLQAAMDGHDLVESGQADSSISIEDVIKAHQLQMTKTPKSADIHYKYGLLMMVAENFADAITSFQTALAINPTHHRARGKLALCIYENGDIDAAVNTLTKADTIPPDTFDLHYKTAILYCDRQKFAKALTSLETTMHGNFTQTDAAVNIQIVLENLGLIDRPTATWDRLTETSHHAINTRFQ